MGHSVLTLIITLLLASTSGCAPEPDPGPRAGELGGDCRAFGTACDAPYACVQSCGGGGGLPPLWCSKSCSCPRDTTMVEDGGCN